MDDPLTLVFLRRHGPHTDAVVRPRKASGGNARTLAQPAINANVKITQAIMRATAPGPYRATLKSIESDPIDFDPIDFFGSIDLLLVFDSDP